jgi:serine/threonine protein kinase
MHDLSSYVEQGDLGGGGFADVVRAVHVATKEVVALKKSRSDEEAKARTRREIEIQGLRLHANIMPVLDSADDGSWFTMPLATGDLGRVHERHPLRDADILRLVEDCAAALGVAHRNGYVHRDLSPPNILWMGDRWAVADWGCVKMPDGKHRTALTRARTAMGTVPWAAPEALEDGREIDARADVFSLGRIVGWLVSGKVPEPNKESPIDGTSPWRKFVIETTRADVDERPATIYAALELLEPVIASLGASRELQMFPERDKLDASRVAVDALKRFLVDPQKRIELTELVTRETEAVFERLNPEDFSVQRFGTDETLDVRLGRYVECCSPLIALVVAGCAYGEEAQTSLWSKMLRRVAHPSGEWGGDTRLLALRYLPATLLLHAGGLAAVAGERWFNLRALALDTRLRNRVNDEEAPAVFAAGLHEALDNDLAKTLPGRDRRYAPASEWLFDQLREPLRFLLPSDPDYEDAFDRLEYVMALAYADTSKSGYAPPGRVIAKRRRQKRFKIPTMGERLEKEILEADKTPGAVWAPVRAGLFESSARVLAVLRGLEKQYDTLSWH